MGLWGTLSFVFCLLIFLFAGAIASYWSKKSEKDYLLGGASFPHWVVGLSTGATGNSGFILVASVGLGYTLGFGAFLYVIGFFIGELIFWNFFATRILQARLGSGSSSVPELISFGVQGKPGIRSILAFLTFIFIGVYFVAQVVAAAKIVESMFGFPLIYGSSLTVVLILLYCTYGGLRASIWTDIVQAVLILFLTTTACITALVKVGWFGGMSRELAEIDVSLLSLSMFSEAHFSVLYLLGSIFLGFGFTLSSPHLTIRLMAAKSALEVRKAKWSYFGFLYSTWGAMTLFGITCRILMPELGDPEQGLPVYVTTFFPEVFIGIALAGMFSTIASTADSQLLACSSALSHDLLADFNKKVSPHKKMNHYYLSTLFVGLVGLFFALADLATVFDLVVFSTAILTSTVGAAMIIRVTSFKVSSGILMFSMSIGMCIALLWRYFGWHVFLSDAAPGLISALGVYYLVSWGSCNFQVQDHN